MAGVSFAARRRRRHFFATYVQQVARHPPTSRPIPGAARFPVDAAGLLSWIPKFHSRVARLGEYRASVRPFAAAPTTCPDAGKLNRRLCPDRILSSTLRQRPFPSTDGSTPRIGTRCRGTWNALASVKPRSARYIGLGHAPRRAMGVQRSGAIVNHTLRGVRPDRVMFGGDGPVCTLVRHARGRGVQLQTRAVVDVRRPEDSTNLFHDNRRRRFIRVNKVGPPIIPGCSAIRWVSSSRPRAGTAKVPRTPCVDRRLT